MLKKPVLATLLAFAMALSAAAILEAGDPGDERVIVLTDEANDDFDVDVDVADTSPMVVHVDRDRSRGYIGVGLVDITPALREHFGVSKDAGVMVGSVVPDSPAAKAGVQVGDILTGVDGENIDSPSDLSRAVRHKKAGDTLTLDLSRDRAKKKLTVTVSDRPAREGRMAERAPKMKKYNWVFPHGDFDTQMLAPLEDMGRLQDRLNEIEKRLKDLEKKLPAK